MAITVDGESRQAFFVYLADGGERPVVQKLDLVRNFPRAEPHTGQVVDATADSQLAPAAR